MHKSNVTPAPIVKGDSFGKLQCPKNQYEIDQMKAVPYASAVGSLQYAQVCTRPDLAFITGILGRYQGNLGIEHWKMVKKALRYAQGTNDLMLTYRRSDSLEIRGYSTQILRETKMIENPRNVICSLSQEGLFRREAPNSQ
jgi:hypothetical protein